MGTGEGTGREKAKTSEQTAVSNLMLGTSSAHTVVFAQQKPQFYRQNWSPCA